MKVPLTTTDSLTRATQVYPVRTGVVDEPGPHQHGGLGSLTYAELAARAAAVAAGLDALGVGRGERVAVVSHDSARMLECFFGVTSGGRVYVPAPTSVELREAIPRTATGKVQKFKLCKQYWQGHDRRVS